MISEVECRERYLDLLKKVLTAYVYDESAWFAGQVQGRNWFKDLVYRTLGRFSLKLVKVIPFDPERRTEGRDWLMFGYTQVGLKRLDNLQACVEDVLEQGVPGDFIEAGVWRGGTTIFMRALLDVSGVEDRKVWVADSFEGMPRPKSGDDGWDLSRAEYLKVSLDQVQANFAKFGLLDDQVEFLPGWFSETLPDAPIDRLAILRLDADMYHSTMDTLTSLYHKVSKGGYVIVDDYYSWPANQQAVSDFLKERSLKPEVRRIDWTGAYWQV